jgi:hypothetical protein
MHKIANFMQVSRDIIICQKIEKQTEIISSSIWVTFLENLNHFVRKVECLSTLTAFRKACKFDCMNVEPSQGIS